MTTTLTQTTTPTARSTGLASTADGAFGEAAPLSRATPVPRPDEPNLFDFPAQLHPTYRPLPWLISLAVAALSAFVSSITTFPTLKESPLHLMWKAIVKRNVGTIVSFLAKTLLIWFASSCLLQDLLLPPSRISTGQLKEQYHLPSSLSRYEKFHVGHQSDVGIHFLEYDYQGDSNFDCVYLNHGFGASSLSFLPTIPALAHRIKCRKSLAHDVAGFGFTDRSNSTQDFTLAASAKLGGAVLASRKPKSVLLIGHSMGSITTLNMALALPPETSVRILLVAPALGLTHRIKKRVGLTKGFSKFTKTVLSPLILLGNVGLKYALRRAVGKPGFWKTGLKLFWGDPTMVTESDALRFQWPAVGKGWEDGFLRFTSAQVLPTEFTDRELMQQVLDRGIRVDCIVAKRDTLVPEATVREFMKDFPGIRILSLDDLGHDPFEEDVPTFLDAVCSLLQD